MTMTATTAALPSPFDRALYIQYRPLIEAVLRLYRIFNTSLDVMFYDVEALNAALATKGRTIQSLAAATGSGDAEVLDLTAPAGAVIIVNASTPSLIDAVFTDMESFFDHANGSAGVALHTLAVTGVGSSALGSVAFAWDISSALGEPVAAIVPGYGVADVLPQALGGWYWFQGYDAIQSASQALLASLAPWLASFGKELALSTRGRPRAPTGAPVFREGSAASDDVHAILLRVPGITRLVGHSKGALAIENALRSLPAEQRHRDIHIFTFGCTIAEQFKRGRYFQSLGVFDGLGLWNSPAYPLLHPGSHIPESWRGTVHSTNTTHPLSMPVGEIMRETRVRAL
jgi:hypothetical protein